MGKKTYKKIKRIFMCYIPVTILVLITLFPYYWFINISLTDNNMIMKLPVYYYPKHFSLSNYTKILTVMEFERNFMNSLVVSLGTTIVIMILSIFGGYALSRYNFKGKSGIMLLLLLTQMFPAIMPGIVTCGAFAFINAWNEFTFSLNFISTSSKFTIPVALSMMQGEFTVNYGGIAAGTIIALIPIILIFCYIQKYLVGGLTDGAVKG